MSILTSAKRNAGQRVHRAHVGVEIETLAQGDVDTGEAASDGRGDGTLQADAGAVQAGENAFGERLAGLENEGGVELGDFPIDGDAGGIDGPPRGLRDFGTNAIAGNERYRVRHLPIVGSLRNPGWPGQFEVCDLRPQANLLFSIRLAGSIVDVKHACGA